MGAENTVQVNGNQAAPIQTSQVVAPKPVEVKPVETKVEPKFEAPKVNSSDILSRSQAKQAEAAPVEAEINPQAELDKITDPAQRAIIEKKLKDLESGYNKKYQTLAEQRKELESFKSKVSTWTPQRLAEELRKPEFVQAMQALQQSAPSQEWTGTQEEWSALSTSEKQQFQQMRNETLSLQTQMMKMQQKEEDMEIKKLYPDYEPSVVEEAIEGLRSGQITASRADIWKVVNHDKNVEKGYQFGYEDGFKKALEKLNASSITANNGSMVNADEVPEEVRKGGFSSIAMWRYQRSRNGQTKK